MHENAGHKNAARENAVHENAVRENTCRMLNTPPGIRYNNVVMKARARIPRVLRQSVAERVNDYGNSKGCGQTGQR